MKFSTGALLCLMATTVSAKKGKSKNEPTCPLAPTFPNPPGSRGDALFVDYKDYLVGLLSLPSDFTIPDFDKTTAYNTDVGPLSSIPIVGITDITDVLVNRTTKTDPKTGEILEFVVNPTPPTYYTMVGEGYGTSDVSVDFPLHYHKITFRKRFVYNHAGTKFNIYDPVDWQETILIKDPDKLIDWKSEWDGHPLDIQVVYGAPTDWLGDWKPDRVLTGRDFSPEGMATVTHECAVVAEKWGPSIFAMDPSKGNIISGLVPVPNIVEVRDPDTDALLRYDLNGDDLLTTVSDKRHCYLHEVAANECGIVAPERIDENGYYEYRKDANGKKEKVFVRKFTRISTESAWAGIVRVYNGGELFGRAPIVGMFHSALPGDPGARVYQISPGGCSADCPPEITRFLGWYPFSVGANRVGAFTNIIGAPNRLLVHEHNSAFPRGISIPRAMPRDRLCMVNLDDEDVEPQRILPNKVCILDFMHINDPYDVDQDGSGVYAHSQSESGGLQVVNDYCVLIGTDNGFPLNNNDYGLVNDATTVDYAVPFFMEAVQGNRFFFVCFLEPIFLRNYFIPGLSP